MATMYDPAHSGESLRDAMEAAGWTVTDPASKLGCTRQTFSRLLNGRTCLLADDGVGLWNASAGAMPHYRFDARRSTTWPKSGYVSRGRPRDADGESRTLHIVRQDFLADFPDGAFDFFNRQ